MEPKYRTAVRTEVPLQVLINYDFNYSKATRVRDLSTEGAFVEMPTTELPQGARVETVFRYRVKGTTREHRLPARIVRVDRDGVALKFGAYDDDTYTGLINLLFAYNHGRIS